MLFLALQNLRNRWSLFAGSFVALTFGIAIMAILANLTAATITQKPMANGPTRYDAVPLIVQAKQMFSAPPAAGQHGQQQIPTDEHKQLPVSVASTIRSIPGVQNVVVDRSFTAAIINRQIATDPGSLQTGHNWSAAQLTPFHIVQGTAPTNEGVVLAQPFAERNNLRIGSTVRVATPSAIQDFRVVGLATTSSGGGVPYENTIFFSDATAARLSPDANSAEALGVFTVSGQQIDTVQKRIAQALPEDTGLEVVGGSAKGGNIALTVFNKGVQDLAGLLGVLGFVTAFVCVFVVSGTAAFAVGQRRRELALLRLIGTTQRRIRRMVLQEAVIVSLVAAVAGSIIGAFTTGPFLRVVQSFGVAPKDLRGSASILASVIASAVGMLVALIGVYSAARHSARVSPVEALREASAEAKSMSIWRWSFGLLFAIGAVVLMIVLPRISGTAAIPLGLFETEIIVVALVLLLPAFCTPLVKLTAAPLAWFLRSTGSLIRSNIASAKRQTATVVAPIMIAVSLTGSLLGVSSTLSTANRVDAEQRTQANVILSANGGVGVPVSTAQQLQTMPNVDSAAYVVPSTLRYMQNTQNAQPIGAITESMLVNNFDLTVKKGSLDNFTHDAVVLTEDSASDLGLKAGDTVNVALADGTKESLHVAALLATSAGLPEVLVTPDVLSGHVHDPMVTDVYLKTGSSNPSPQLQSFASKNGLQITTKQAWAVNQAAGAAQANNGVLILLLGLSLLYLAVSIANTLLMAVSGRVEDFKLLRKIGATKGKIIGMVFWETTFTTMLGAVLGGLAAFATIYTVYAVYRAFIPHMAIAIPWAPTLVLVGSSLLIALLASVLPTAFRLQRRSFINTIPKD